MSHSLTSEPGSATPTALQAPGFLGGVRCLFRGWSFLMRTPATWPFAWVPSAILFLLLSVLGWTTSQLIFPRIQAALPEASSKLGETLSWGASGLLAVGVFVVGAIVALALTPPLSGPALEKIVSQKEDALGVPSRAPQSFVAEIWCGFRAQVFVAVWVLPILLVLWLLELVVPPAVVVTLPLKLMVTSLALSWNLLDYPLTLRGVRMRERFLLFRRHKAACLGFGAAFAVLFWIPCGCQIVLLPVGAAAATDLVWLLLRSDPTLLPELERPAAAPAVAPPSAPVAAPTS